MASDLARKSNEHSGANQRLRIIVLGHIVRMPLGGMAWSSLNFILGLKRLGHDVYFIEDSDDYVSCFDPERGVMDTDPSYGLRFAADAFRTFGLDDRWAYYNAHDEQWFGPVAGNVQSLCDTADLLLNLCGVNPLRSWLSEIPIRVLVDEDPPFSQIRNLTERGARRYACEHTVHFSFGENGTAPEGQIPDDGFSWLPLRQPVVFDAVTPSLPQPGGMFTTIMQWESYPPREYDGVRYGMKSDSFWSYLDLPLHVGPMFDLAIGGPTVPKAMLREKGWRMRDPRPVTRDVNAYHEFIRGSKAEFGIAKHGYVLSRSGWFSERSAAYMASGRPVLVQETGFSKWLPTGLGVVSFSTLDEAIAGVESINTSYERHCKSARELVEAYFDSDVILSGLVERALEHSTDGRTPRRSRG